MARVRSLASDVNSPNKIKAAIFKLKKNLVFDSGRCLCCICIVLLNLFAPSFGRICILMQHWRNAETRKKSSKFASVQCRSVFLIGSTTYYSMSLTSVGVYKFKLCFRWTLPIPGIFVSFIIKVFFFETRRQLRICKGR